MFIIGQHDIQRKFLIQMGKANLQLYTQLICTVSHTSTCWLLVTHLEMGIRGLTIASFITNLAIFVINHFMMAMQVEFEESLTVSFFDPQVRENIGSYLMIGLPNMTIILLDWMCFQASSLMAGVIGVKEQAINIILLNLLSLSFQTAYGLQ